MLLKRLILFFLIVLLGLGAGIMLIDHLFKNADVSRSLVDLVMLLYLVGFVVMSLIVGRNMEIMKVSEEVDSDTSVTAEPRKRSGKVYAWLLPHDGKTQAGFPIIRKLMIIGRDVHSDIMINDISVSKKHAQITSLPGGFMLRDLESTNGTFINNKRIEESYLGDCDVVTFGEIKYIFSCSDVKPVTSEGEVDVTEFEIEMEDTGTRISTGTSLATGSALQTGSRVSGIRGKRRSRLRDLSEDLSGGQTYTPGSSHDDRDEKGTGTANNPPPDE